jgi:hypothetical protein
MLKRYFKLDARFPEMVLARLEALRNTSGNASFHDRLWLAIWLHDPVSTVRQVGRWPKDERVSFWERMLALDGGQGWVIPLLMEALKAEPDSEVVQELVKWRPSPGKTPHRQWPELVRQMHHFYRHRLETQPEEADISVVFKALFDMADNAWRQNCFLTQMSEGQCIRFWPRVKHLFLSSPESRDKAWQFWKNIVDRREPFSLFDPDPKFLWQGLIELDPQHPEWYELIERHLDWLISHQFTYDVTGILHVMAAWKPRTPAQREHLRQRWEHQLFQCPPGGLKTMTFRHICCQALAHLATGIWPPPVETCFFIHLQYLMKYYGNQEEQSRWQAEWAEKREIHPSALPDDLRARFRIWLTREIEKLTLDEAPVHHWQLLITLGIPEKDLLPLVTSRIRLGFISEKLKTMAHLTADLSICIPWDSLKNIWQEKLQETMLYWPERLEKIWQALLDAVRESPDPALERLVVELMAFHLENGMSSVSEVNVTASMAQWVPSSPALARQLFGVWEAWLDKQGGWWKTWQEYLGIAALHALFRLGEKLPPDETDIRLFNIFCRQLSHAARLSTQPPAQTGGSEEYKEYIRNFPFRHLNSDQLFSLWKELKAELKNICARNDKMEAKQNIHHLLLTLGVKYQNETFAREFCHWVLSQIKTETDTYVLQNLASFKRPDGTPWPKWTEEIAAWGTRLGSDNPVINRVAMDRLLTLWQNASPTQPDWTVYPEFHRLLETLQRETDPEVILAAVGRLSESPSSAVIRAVSHTLARMAHQHPSATISRLARTIHQQWGTGCFISSLLSGNDTSVPADMFHHLWYLVRHGMFPLTSASMPDSWEQLAVAVARHQKPEKPEEALLSCLIHHLKKKKQSRAEFSSPKNGAWERVDIPAWRHGTIVTGRQDVQLQPEKNPSTILPGHIPPAFSEKKHDRRIDVLHQPGGNNRVMSPIGRSQS